MDHPADEPHNRESFWYQQAFRRQHGREPTWTDAMSHCPPRIQKLWKMLLVKVMQGFNMAVPDDLTKR
jgi:hypothetical protein